MSAINVGASWSNTMDPVRRPHYESKALANLTRIPRGRHYSRVPVSSKPSIGSKVCLRSEPMGQKYSFQRDGCRRRRICSPPVIEAAGCTQATPRAGDQPRTAVRPEADVRLGDSIRSALG